MKIVPLQLNLPDGAATLIPGSLKDGQPRYERDGVVLDIDVTIPPDLADRWFWDGAFLRLRVEPGTCGVCICTTTFPPPGYPGERADCFTQARQIAPPAKQVVQLTMELV